MAIEDDQDEGFLNRWARRKAESPPVNDPVPEEKAPADEAAAALSEAEIVAQLPDIESLDETSDFTPFLQEGVPDLLRRRALRVLWRSNPVFANLDGMNEYDEDYTLATSALQAVKTAYQVGKGFITDEERAAMDAEIADAEIADAGNAGRAPDAEDEGAEEKGAEKEEEVAGAEARVPEPEIEAAAGLDSADATPKTDCAADELEAAEVAKTPRAPGSARDRRWGA